MELQYDGTIKHWELKENREPPKNHTSVTKFYFVKCLFGPQT